ncbi:MAG: DUF3291 domain-containing protein [Sphingobacteriales bacterium]|nr:MAG: DUF3291 domain-containing protein [Sphingobacteriales bacterium]
MFVSIYIVKYPKKYIAFAFFAMALHRLPLLLNKKCTFWKLLGCGKNGTFDINPDYQKWGLLTVWQNENDLEEFKMHSFIVKWWSFFCIEQYHILAQPLEAHGKWSGKEPFGNPKIKDYHGQVAVLTRATIRLNKLKNFWANVPAVARIMANAKGFVTSVGIGEAPFFMQATLSVWHSVEDVKNFAYKSKEHAEVIKLTRSQNWYTEELFARFKILKTHGTMDGFDPINNKS